MSPRFKSRRWSRKCKKKLTTSEYSYSIRKRNFTKTKSSCFLIMKRQEKKAFIELNYCSIFRKIKAMSFTRWTCSGLRSKLRMRWKGKELTLKNSRFSGRLTSGTCTQSCWKWKIKKMLILTWKDWYRHSWPDKWTSLTQRLKEWRSKSRSLRMC